MARVDPHQITPEDLHRVNVVGVSGSGKSTFAKALASQLDSPHVEMDALYWGPHWSEPETEAFRARLREATRGPRWILDGNYHSKTHAVKWGRATLIVWLNLSFTLTLRRAVGRALWRSITRRELWAGTGNRESFVRSFLSHDSVVLWTITSYGRVRRRYAHCIEDAAGPPILCLSSPRSVAAFLELATEIIRREA